MMKKLAIILFLLVGFFAITSNASAAPVPDVKANGQDQTVYIDTQSYTAESIRITASLDPGLSSGDLADWWVWADTKWGRFWFQPDNYGGTWVKSDIPIVAHAGPLVTLAPYEIYFDWSWDLNIGRYEIFFAVDSNMDNIFDGTYVDSVTFIAW